MSNYLVGYVKESQITYPNISRSAYEVLNRILLTNGNGVDFCEGEPVSYDLFGNMFFYKDTYKGGGASLSEEIERRLEHLEDDYEVRCLEKLYPCDSLPFFEMFSEKSLLEMMKQVDYRLYLGIHRGYFKGECVSIKSSDALVYAYFHLLKACLSYLDWEERLNKRSVFGGGYSMYQQEPDFKLIYEEELKRMEGIYKRVCLGHVYV